MHKDIILSRLLAHSKRPYNALNISHLWGGGNALLLNELKT